MRTVQHALDSGVTMLDMAGRYSGGGVERLVGRAITGRRDQALLATRAGPWRRSNQLTDRRQLQQACEGSLRRLGVEHIDLFYLDQFAPTPRGDKRLPVGEAMSELSDLVAAGKIRHIGLSGASADELRAAHAVHPVAALACEYSLWERQAEAGPLAVARELGVGLIACRPLGRGFLAGRIASPDPLDTADCRHGDPRFQRENLLRYQRVLQTAAQVAAEFHVGLSRLALAWLLAQGEDVIPIPGTRTGLHLEMNAAARLQLAADERDRLTALFPPTAVSADGAPPLDDQIP